MYILNRQKGEVMKKKKAKPEHNAKYCWGRRVAIYINRNKKWLKIGTYCNQCGVVIIDSKFETGLPRS